MEIYKSKSSVMEKVWGTLCIKFWYHYNNLNLTTVSTSSINTEWKFEINPKTE